MATSGGAVTIEPGTSENPTSSAKSPSLCLPTFKSCEGECEPQDSLDLRTSEFGYESPVFPLPLYLELRDEFSHCLHWPADLSRER